MNLDLSKNPKVNQEEVGEYVARFKTPSIDKESKVHYLELAFNMLDLTTLNGTDTEGRVKKLQAVRLTNGVTTRKALL